MSNTIELLETIGKDASLRYASGESLAQMLSGRLASECLLSAARSGDRGQLTQEFGQRDIKTSHSANQEPVPADDDDLGQQDDDGRDGSEVTEH
ncbi:MAG: hypothetical protein OQK79_11290 [Rhodanobacter sp.]|jgi:hypothetical protein|nr:hypothetical protein [Rhodanobacter sp.]